jgi:predicted nucleotidyltransferase
MTTVALLHSTGDALADHVVLDVVNLFESALPQRVIGYFVEGSYADQTAVATSDLDLTIVFQEQFVTTAERQRAQEVVTACRLLTQLISADLEAQQAARHLLQNTPYADPAILQVIPTSAGM